MTAVRHRRRIGAWFALCGLALQIVLTAGHAARHLDHLVAPHGPLVLVADATRHDAHSTPTNNPPLPESRDCAVDLCLAAAGSAVLADPGLAPRPLSYRLVRFEGPSHAAPPAVLRHRLPPARAPPVIEAVV